MKILHSYIAKTILLATALAALVIIGVSFLITLLGEFKNIGEGDYGMMQAVFYVLLRLPNELYQFSPLLILLGSILGLSALSSYRELAVMRASGFSIRQIIASVFSAVLLLVLLMGIIGEWAAPALSYTAEVRKENAQNAGQAVVTDIGMWFHVNNNFIHVNQVIGRQLLEGVTRYQFDDQHRLQEAYYAKKLSFQDGQWIMVNVVKTTFSGERTKSFYLEKANWDLKLNSNLFNRGLLDPNEMSLHKLAKFSHYLKQNGIQAGEYQFQFWQRLFQPLASLIMIFLAIPFVLGTFSSATLGWRIIIGILVGFAFYITNAMLGQICIVFQFPTILAALCPIILFACVSIFLSRKLIRN